MKLDGNPKGKYVVWIDIMGSGVLMRTSVGLTKRAIETLHSAVELATSENVQAFPMNDGVFLVCTTYTDIQRALSVIFTNIHQTNLDMFNPTSATKMTVGHARKLILVRASIAYGPTITSRDNSPLNDRNYGHVVLGPAVSNAYASESNVGPFGVFVHESARMHGERRYRTVFQRYGPKNRDLSNSIFELLASFYEVAATCPFELGYRLERQIVHKALASEFFQRAFK